MVWDGDRFERACRLPGVSLRGANLSDVIPAPVRGSRLSLRVFLRLPSRSNHPSSVAVLDAAERRSGYNSLSERLRKTRSCCSQCPCDWVPPEVPLTEELA